MPAILEQCVGSVKSRLLEKTASKRGIKVSEVSAKTKKNIESKAYAICTASLKKAGKM